MLSFALAGEGQSGIFGGFSAGMYISLLTGFCLAGQHTNLCVLCLQCCELIVHGLGGGVVGEVAPTVILGSQEAK